MTEWHITPEYIVNNWTDEEMALMVEKLVERKQRINNAITEAPSGSSLSGDRVVSDMELFRQMGKKVKVIKKEN